MPTKPDPDPEAVPEIPDAPDAPVAADRPDPEPAAPDEPGAAPEPDSDPEVEAHAMSLENDATRMEQCGNPERAAELRAAAEQLRSTPPVGRHAATGEQQNT